MSTQLAIDGGPKTKTTPYGSHNRFQGNELDYLRQALEQGTLFYGHGSWVKRACQMMADYTGRPYVVPCTSGSAAIHLGLIAAGIGPGDEVITTPNTDSGTVLGIIEEGAVPVFCDCGDHLQPTAAAIEAKITARTRAIVVVHLAGCPAPMNEIMALSQARNLPVVEDVAQSWGTTFQGQRAGTFGIAGCFSTNDFKHISTGDGGFVALADEALYRRVSNYADKHYDRLFGGALMQAHHGLNYRMTELQGAVAAAQLEQVDGVTARHHQLGELLRPEIGAIPGLRMLAPVPGGYNTYWWTAWFIEPQSFRVTRDRLVEALRAEGLAIGTYQRYDLIRSGLFQQRVVRPWLDDARRHYPFDQPDGRSYHYSHDQVPNHKRLLDTGFMMSIKAWHTDADMCETAAGIRKVLTAFQA